MKIEFSTRFLKSYKKLVSGRPDVAITSLQKILLFSDNPLDPTLKFHKLKGKLSDTWSFSIEENLRVLVDRKDASKYLFVDIGTHNQVY
jgi:addiction module RelE/StbE family toxin